MPTRYTETMPVAEAEALHTTIENLPDSPRHTEPLTVGSAFPDGYRPEYNWTSVVYVPGNLFDADTGEPVPVLNAPAACIAMPRGGWQDGWAENAISQARPGTTNGETNWSQIKLFTEPLPMAEGLAMAATAEASWGQQQSAAIRIPRPLEGEQPDGTATWVVLGVASQNQQAFIQGANPQLLWFDTLPDAPTEMP